MIAFDVLQAAIIAAVLGYSAWTAFRKLMPELSRRLLGRLSARLDRPAHGVAVRRVGRWLQPAEAKSGGCGSGDGCGSCNGCAPAPTLQDPHIYPLQVRPRR